MSMGTDMDMDFPPKQSSKLWQDVFLLKQRRLRSPQIICCSAGTADGARFEGYIDRSEVGGRESEPHVAGSSYSFTEFLGFIHREVLACHLEDGPTETA